MQAKDFSQLPTLVLGTRSEVLSWDPAMANVNDTQQIYQSVYDTIIRRGPDGTLHPMLGTAWSYDSSQTALTVELRSGVTFSDGEAFNAAVVKANMENLQAANGPQSATVRNVASVEIVDDDTVVYHLKEPDPAFLIYLCGTAEYQGSPAQIGSDAIKVVPAGTGPYVYDAGASTVATTYKLLPREDYWDPDLQKFSSITFQILPDHTARLNALLSGQIDGGLIEPTMASQVERAGKTVLAYEVDWSGFFIMDRARDVSPALADVRVRRAINLAINRPGLVQAVLEGRGTPMSQPFGPATAAYDPELDTYYRYNRPRPKRLMAEAGCADGFDVTLPLTASFTPGAVPILTQQLSEIGIRVTYGNRSPNWGTFVGEVSSGKYPMPAMNQIQGDTWIEVRKLIAPTGLYNPLPIYRSGSRYADGGDAGRSRPLWRLRQAARALHRRAGLVRSLLSSATGLRIGPGHRRRRAAGAGLPRRPSTTTGREIERSGSGFMLREPGMIAFLAKRLATAVGLLLAITVVTFMLLYVGGGSVAGIILGDTATDKIIAKEVELGLDRPDKPIFRLARLGADRRLRLDDLRAGAGNPVRACR